MKVISLLEPWASLIKEQVKHIETRSWATKYRGELYIHASKRSLTKQNLIDYQACLSLLKDQDFKYGYIIAKCKLVDCRLMDEKLIKSVKKNHPNQYLCGDWQVGRYAWVLKDIEVLEMPILAKGQLGIWDYYNENDIMNLMNSISYGWLDKNHEKHFMVDELYSENYILQSPREVIKNGLGVCWDQAELERYYFKSNDWSIQTYFLCHYDQNKCPTHTFLTYKKNHKVYWFEHSWAKYAGIHEYNSLKELLVDVRNKFINTELNNHYQPSNLLLRPYSKPQSGLSVVEFYKHGELEAPIELDNL